ncbi:carbohydrate ABC transporter permease [Microbacterium azadirachtae]|uniref:carbohydrate ABC transporter permease n=1 Tax=Microbacterium azadirachtae TaxID=582680 RepID=UPI00088CE7C0|nr:carbohydrate ABC transporter permease [Microbacterium azadirachtae]UXW85580.1 carbohydrate ABC transporter permease [Microbacterium azadirachtae]SDM19521.1 carbohydrate ABC transporter membrane protein 2, CUT1 family [Microbacterium azadirachtae]SEG42145.1 carbohydrate ABC transporter membrane protein 2, CUT1 family [Microbacterium azadirachtae]SEG45173.1 carbohydrate ABC transporter membrane protein 2, CUT1 family [Microbacterium azadirachtae]
MSATDVGLPETALIVEEETRRRKPAKERMFRTGGSGDITKPTVGGLIGRYVLLVVVLVLVIGPFLWQLSTSFKGPGESLYTFPPNLIPAQPTVDNYRKVTDFIPVYQYAWRSLFVALVSVATNVVFALMGGYALACMKFRGKRIALGILFSTMLLPGEVTVTSNLLTVNGLGLANTLWGVILPGAIGAMNVLLIATACRMIPAEVLDAATVDGATTWQRIRHIVWPNVRGMTSVVAIFTFIGAWDDYLWPLMVITDPNNYTLTVGMAYLNSNFSPDPRLIAAGTIIALIPIIVLFSVTQRFFFSGVQEGAVKG